MRGYAAESNIHRVLYMTDDQRVGRLFHTASSLLGLSALIHLQRVKIVVDEPA
jgi:hypothetical protein